MPNLNNLEATNVTRIKVVGVGGGGSNAVARMFRDRIPGVEYIVVNTDLQSLLKSDVPVRLAIGEQLTKGRGAGGIPEIGGKAADESREELFEALRDADMVFVAAGMGGGTGTGAAPVIAEIIQETGALTVGVVTTPFGFEGLHRMKQAEAGMKNLREHVDTLIAIPNERLHIIAQEEITADNAFKIADDVLRLGVQSIAELVTIPGEINVDFADVLSIMHKAGPAWMSIGWGTGEHRARDAAQQAITNPLLDTSIDGAKGVLFNITGGSGLKLSEMHEAAEVIQRVVDEDANIIFGMVKDLKMEEQIKLTIIATGFPSTDEIRSKDEDLSKILTYSESELDIPPFLRRITKYQNGHSHKNQVSVR